MAAAAAGAGGGAIAKAAITATKALTHSPPLPPPHDLSECPAFAAAVVARATKRLSRAVADPELARRIARVVAADASAGERADTDVLSVSIADACTPDPATGHLPDDAHGPWSRAALALVSAQYNATAPGLGLWYRALRLDVRADTPLQWSTPSDRAVLECIAWACLKQGMRLNYRADDDIDTPFTAAAFRSPAFTMALLSLPPRIARQSDVNVTDAAELSPLMCCLMSRRHSTGAGAAEVVAALGARTCDRVLNDSVAGEFVSPLQRATQLLCEAAGGGASANDVDADAVATFRAVIALSRPDGSGVCIADAPYLFANDRRAGAVRYASPRDAFDALVKARGGGGSAAGRCAAPIEQALADADAAVAAVRAYPNALLPALCDALQPSPLSALRGVLQLVASYVVIPPLPLTAVRPPPCDDPATASIA